METVATTTVMFPPNPQCLMFAVKPPPPHLLRRCLTPAAAFRLFSSVVTEPSIPKPKSNNKKPNLDAKQLKLNWLDSLSCPCPQNQDNSGPGWVIGVDPDLSGALAVLKPDNTPQVYDSPHLNVMVGKRVRKRLDVKSIIQLLQSVDAPIGTSVYIEQSIPYPKDGKQIREKFSVPSGRIGVEAQLAEVAFEFSRMERGWWSGGFGYGLWIGILVASGYSVVPVPSSLWKNQYKLTGLRSNKDDSRELAATLFPSMSSLLKRKKDHGRAEALLIAAFGKGLKVNDDPTCILEDLLPEKQDKLEASIY